MSTSSSFSYTQTRIGIIVAIISICSLMISAVIFGVNPNRSQQLGPGYVSYPTSLQGLAVGCGDIFTFEPLERQYGVIPEDKLDDIRNIPSGPTIIPTYGYMTGDPLSEEQIRFYDKNELKTPIPREQILHTMYALDTVVVWYQDSIPPDDYEILKEYVEKHENVLAVKWEYGNRPFPSNRKVAISTWGMSQTCEFWNDSVATDFSNFAKENRIDRPDTAPEARMTENILPPLTLPQR
jgi:hypothetical protein